MAIRKHIETLLDDIATFIVPLVMVVASAVFAVQGLKNSEIPLPQVLPIKVWKQDPAADPSPSLEAVRQKLAVAASVNLHPTDLSTDTFWLLLDVGQGFDGAKDVVEFPSRHATNMVCWDAQTGVVLGNADRTRTQGQLRTSRGGFALTANPAGQAMGQVLCKADYRGPAKITAQVWPKAHLQQAQNTHRSKGVMIEAGIGVLALFMLVTAWVNRSLLYWTFVGWLLLSMRTASISAGTDWTFFGMWVEPAYLPAMRQWTLCLYFASTAAMFCQVLKAELLELRAGVGLFALQALALVTMCLPLVLTFEQTLLWLWPCTPIGMAFFVWYLFRIFARTQSRVARWYAASIAAALLTSISEIVAAAFGPHALMGVANHVNGGLLSALFASLALAERVRAERLEKLKAQKTLEAAYQDSPMGLFTVAPDGRIVKFNPAFQTMIRGAEARPSLQLSHLFENEAVVELAKLQSLHRHGTIELETRMLEAGVGGARWFAVKASTLEGGIIEGSLQDITERVLATRQLEFLVSHDALTECLNLRGIANSFEGEDLPQALAYLDLDRFKLINDLYGHHAGDNVLQQVCARIQRHLGAGDQLARVGGDEFVIAFGGGEMEHIVRTCRDIVGAISNAAYPIDTQSFTLSVSCGLVATEQFTQSPLKEIISAADTLCRMAKKSADRLVVMGADSEFFQQHKDELELIAELERGQTPEGLFLMMQPEISLTKPFDSLNFEVLVRLRKHSGQVLSAKTIMDAAEAHGKTALIDRWVVRSVIDWLETHAQQLTNTHFVGVNLSGGSLNDEAFTEELFTLLAQHPVAISMLCIEITETVALTDMQNMQRFIQRVRKLGAKVGLDDFGAGYSSFGYLKGLTVDALKLDGSLVRDAARGPSSTAIVEAIAGLVTNLGMKSVGEFAENLATIQILSESGVDYAQGYGISRPVMPDRILLARSSADFIDDPATLAFFEDLLNAEPVV